MTNPKLIEGQQLESLEANDGTLKIWTNGTDPYVWLHLDKEELYPVLEKDYTQKLWIKNILMLLLIDSGAGCVCFPEESIDTSNRAFTEQKTDYESGKE